MSNILDEPLGFVNNMGTYYSDHSITLQRKSQICINILENNYSLENKSYLVYYTRWLHHV